MTREEKIEAFTMRLDGYTLQEIGDHFGLSRERIRAILYQTTTASGIARKQYVYPNIAKWMIENKISPGLFSKKIGCSQAAVSNWMTGKRDPSYKFINLVLKETGMTYEEAFKREDPNEKTNP